MDISSFSHFFFWPHSLNHKGLNGDRFRKHWAHLRNPQIHSSCIATNIKVEAFLLHTLLTWGGQVTSYLLWNRKCWKELTRIPQELKKVLLKVGFVLFYIFISGVWCWGCTWHQKTWRNTTPERNIAHMSKKRTLHINMRHSANNTSFVMGKLNKPCSLRAKICF